MTHQQRPIHWGGRESRGMNHLLKNLGYAEEGGRRAALNCLYLVSWPGRLRKKTPTSWQSGCSYVQYVMQLCTHFYKEIGEWRGGSWWVHMCDVLPVLLFASRQFLLVLLWQCYVARILLVNQPQVSSFLVHAPFGWLTNQFWIVIYVTVFVEFPYFSCRCSTEVSTSTFLCAAGVKDSSVTMWFGSTTIVFRLPKPRFTCWWDVPS